MSLDGATSVLVTITLVEMMVVVGLQVTLAELVDSFGNWRLLGRAAVANYVVVPSIWWENSPVVIQEAYAARRPVICSGIGGMAEKVIDGVTGLHVLARSSMPRCWSRSGRSMNGPAEPTAHPGSRGSSDARGVVMAANESLD